MKKRVSKPAIKQKDHSEVQTTNKIIDSKIILILPFLLFLYVFIVNAWVGDDAYITFRTIDNFISGHGLTWNITERVQAYTHPLWMMLMSIFYFFTGEPYFTSIFLSLSLVIGSFWLISTKLNVKPISVFIGIITLCLSKAFVDYTSSGLENPLTYILLTLFVVEYIKNEDKSDSRLLHLSLITSLIMLNRLDTVLIVAPALAWEFWRNKSVHNAGHILIGLIPFLVWEAFSLFYYGFPFPNTAYAKLGSGIPAGALISQGLAYFSNSFIYDPLTLIMIFSALVIVFSLTKLRSNYFALALGIIFYLLYIIKIGGDFMSGRFFAAPLFLAVILLVLSAEGFRFRYVFSAMALIIIIGIIPKDSPIKSSSEYGKIPIYYPKSTILIPFTDMNGITDERAIYNKENGLLPVMYKGSREPFAPIVFSALLRKKSKEKVLVKGVIGMLGYYAGPQIHIIDPLALADPLLSRLTMDSAVGKIWRIGHFERKLPEGYFESIKLGRNVIKDKNIRELYDKITTITKKSIFTKGRLSEIVAMNLGRYDALSTAFYNPNSEEINLLIAKATEFAHSKSFDKLDTVMIQLRDRGVDYSELRNMYLKWVNEYSDKKDHETSLTLLIHANSVGLENEVIDKIIGVYYVNQNDYINAEKAWLRAIKLNPDYIQPYTYLFFLYYEMLGDKAKAYALANELISLGEELPPDILRRYKTLQKSK